ncbi:unnamed protein product [Musa acuminata subsp. malaccensis]|uniref:(wild Malaysian banana) hypothetical protein n=1 Tax=Musa acuminata subsp. malaccensis TaxID=214687 RepID=A0A804IVD1_MUSAM|nr:PREDICTED: pathogenesis-related protein PRB1-2-like [Musa acuminata subsp. malaccensis]CAG1843769.1 unnamed protein product [Musa acuminata subsp. malaccensis]
MRSSNPALAMLCTVALAMACTSTLAQNSPQDFVSPHNAARTAVGVVPVSWDSTVAAYAQNYANQRAADCQLVHSGGPYGENIFSGFGRDYTAADAIKYWVSEKQYYNHNSNKCAPNKVCGHYTQVVWRSSTAIGCGRVRCNSGGIFITCNYKPPGNIEGQSPY